MQTPRILIWDIETAHALAAIFSLFENITPIHNIQQEWYIISIAWKWFGERKVYAASVLDDKARFAKNPNDDYHVCKTIHEIISEADAIVHHYGDNFDIKKLNTRLLYHGFDPLPPIIQIDTYKIAKAKFKFMSNRLDYIATYLGLDGKMHTPYGLWLECLAGNVKAIKKMVEYNKQDVNVLEQVYIKLAPFIPAKLNLNHFFGEETVCPNCGDDNLEKRGFSYSRVSTFQRHHCKSCGAWSQRIVSPTGRVGGIR